MDTIELNDREKTILRNIINQFVLTATPVGSRNIAKKFDLGLSPATIRNIMADLEESGFLDHPHTSAGRIPTDKGYRFYVDSLMDPPMLKSNEKDIIKQELKTFTDETDQLLYITSTLLSDITKQLACVTYPQIDSGTLEKIQIVQLTSSRILVVVSIKMGLVKTITLELSSDISNVHLAFVETLLNERLSGLTLSEIKKTFGERFEDVSDIYRPIIRVFLNAADKIFTDKTKADKAVITGAKNILKQPEFEKHDHFQSFIELIEDKEVVLNFIAGKSSLEDQLIIKIGSENDLQKLNNYSVISREYKIGDVSGTLGIVGPRRMQYSKIIAIVNYVAEMLTEYLKKGSS